MRRGLAIAVLGLGLALPAAGGPPARESLPEPLRSWVDWVLADRPEAGCPFLDARGERWCAWSGRLALELEATGGSFAQHWRLWREQWVPLPGDAEHWPDQVRVDGRAVAVVPHPGATAPRGARALREPPASAARPGVRLAAGVHRVTGRFAWSGLPPLLAIPAETGLVELRVAGRSVARPQRDVRGRLWLGPREVERGPPDRLEIEVHRRLADGVPIELETLVELRVSGASREVQLGRALPERFVAMSLEGALPARLEREGRLRVQVRPGSHRLRIHARHPGPAGELTLPDPGGPWSAEEVWVFEASPLVRVVNVEGAPAIDPQQTRLPAAWRALPAYRLAPGGSLRLVERARGDPDPIDRLALHRSLWLDFEGDGWTFRDRMAGRLRRPLRLESGAGMELGRFAVNGQDWFLTRLADDAPVGVEIPAGPLAAEADGRFEGTTAQLPVLGWQRGFDAVSAELALPPGWRLLHARGADAVSRDWITSWNLLDLFLVLVAASAASQLFGRRWGALTLATLALTWIEPAAPRAVWIVVLVCEALVRVLASRRLAGAARGLRLVSWAALVLVALPFLFGEIQRGLYPALAPPRVELWARDVLTRAPQPLDLAQEAPVAKQERLVRERAEAGAGPAAEEPAAAPPAPPPDLRRLDPDARVPTGPGVPRWSWERVELAWSGPVQPDQGLGLVLLSPFWNRLLSFVRAALVIALAVGWMRRGVLVRPPPPPTPAGAVALLALAIVAAHAPAASADIPPRELLDELRERLLEPPACAPRCASLPALALELRATALRVHLELHAAVETAVPLPGEPGHWDPARVRVDGEAALALRRDGDGRLWLVLPPGVHDVLLEGPIDPGADAVELSLPLTPHRVRAEAPGWQVLGLDAEGRPTGALQLRRLEPGKTRPAGLAPSELPPFARLERTLELGVTWSVANRLVRLTPPGEAFVLEVPLLEGEAVTTPGIGVERGRAQVTLAPSDRERRWTSALEPRARLRLAAPEGTPWVEVWRLETTPLWHVASEGLAPVGVSEADPRPVREWRPWPGEALRLEVRRPAGVGGETLTIDASRLELRPGRRRSAATLALELRSSQGGRHAIRLPEGATLRAVRVDGEVQPIRAEDREVALPLAPGVHRAELDWETEQGIGARLVTPSLELRAPSVNLETVVNVPANRWVLQLGGPRLGPSVRFWSVLVVLVAVAVGLARLGLTPLGTASWFLLGIGLTQVPVWMAAGVAGWLLALGWRGARAQRLHASQAFDFVQLGLALWTLAALAILFVAVRQGLLGLPDMQVAGNGSSASLLRWYQDRAAQGTPRQAWVLWVPLFFYRLAMLAWALWLAGALVRWLRWGWGCFAAGGVWRAVRLRSRRGRPDADA